MKTIEQPTGDGGTAGVAVLEPKRGRFSVASEPAQHITTEALAPVPADPPTTASFDSPIKLLDTEPRARVLDTSFGDRTGIVVNIAAEAIGRGGTVLFLSNDQRHLQAVEQSLCQAGLRDISLTLDARTRMDRVIDELRRTLQQGPPTSEEKNNAAAILPDLEARSNMRIEAMAKEVDASGVSPYEAMSAIISGAFRRTSSLGTLDFTCIPLREWDSEKFTRCHSIAREVDECLRAGGSPENNPWRGAAQSKEKEAPGKESIESTLQKLTGMSREISGFLSDLGFDANLREDDVEKILRCLKIIEGMNTDNGEAFKEINLRPVLSWIRDREEIIGGIETELQIAEAGKKLEGRVNLDALRDIDLKAVSQAVLAHQSKNAFSKMFDGDFGPAIKELEKVAPMPESIHDVIKIISHLESLKALQDQAAQNQDLWERLFPVDSESKVDALTLWRRRAQLSSAVIEILTEKESLVDADGKTILAHLKKPEQLYANSVKLQEALSLLAEFKELRRSMFDAVGIEESEQEAGFRTRSFAEQEKRIRAMTAGAESWRSWQKFAQVAENARAEGLEPLITHILSQKLAKPSFEAELKQARYKVIADDFSAARSGKEDEGLRQSEEIGQMLSIDTLVRDQNARETATRHWEESPRYIVGGQSSELYRQISKESPATSIEMLFSKAPRALQHAKPLILADVATAERVTAAAPMHFDFVILDHGVIIPNDHPLRTKANVRCVTEVADYSSELQRVEATQLSATRSVSDDAPKADWRTPLERSSISEDRFQTHLKKVIENTLPVTVQTNVITPAGIIDILVTAKDSSRTKCAVLIDGHNAQCVLSALDREKGRNAAAVSLGVQDIRREWILDWYLRPDGSKKDLINSISRAMRTGSTMKKVENTREIPRDPLQAQHVTLLHPYQKATVDLTQLRVLQRSQGHLRPSEVATALATIVEQEGPIHRDELSQRFLQCCGIRTLNNDMALQIVEGEQSALKHKKVVIRDDFLYSPDAARPVYPRMRGDLSGTLARFERIAPEELEAAVCQVVKRSYGISRQELPAQIFKAFGYKGVPFGADAVLDRELKELIKSKVLVEENGMLSLGSGR